MIKTDTLTRVDVKLLIEVIKCMNTTHMVSVGNTFYSVNLEEFFVPNRVVECIVYNTPFNLKHFIYSIPDLKQFVSENISELYLDIDKNRLVNSNGRVFQLNIVNSTITYNSYRAMIPEHTFLDDSDAKNDPVFIEYSNMRADDGLIIRNYKGHMISLFAGLINLNKSDNLRVQMKSYDAISNLALFHVYKKKLTCTTIVRYMNMK